MNIHKSLVVSNRVRSIPTGFGWVDHRLLQDGYLRECSTDALALYLILTAVADQDGLSYYGNRLLCTMLGWHRRRLELARDNLRDADLAAYCEPIYQVLSLPEATRRVHHDK